MRGDAALEAPVERIRRHLVGLRMPRALETLDQLVQQLERGQVGAIEAIETLLVEEITIREGRRVKAVLQMARLTPIKTLSSFDFSFQPSLDRSRIMALAALDFIDRHEVVHFIGQSGTGKSHLAIALGVEAVRAGRSVYFSPLADIIDSLARAEREGRLRERIRYLCRASLLIIDEIGYLSIGAGAGNLFFQLVNARYERGAMILTSNRGFAEWGQVLATPWSRPPCWTGFFTTPSWSTSRAPATGSVNMPTCWEMPCDQTLRRRPTCRVVVDVRRKIAHHPMVCRPPAAPQR
jgi:DNA replication protein DnaC